jgi:hypothetical protein
MCVALPISTVKGNIIAIDRVDCLVKENDLDLQNDTDASKLCLLAPSLFSGLVWVIAAG